MKPIATAAQNMPRSGIRKVLDMASKIPDAIHLEIGQPDFPTPGHIVEAAAQAGRDGFTRYTANAGMPELREAVAEKISRENGWSVTADNVVITVGGMGGLYTTFAGLLEPGEEIMLPNPSWPNYNQMAFLCRAGIVYYPLVPERGFQPDLKALSGLVTPRTKVILVNSPSNPTGSVFPRDTMKALVAFAQEHDLYILSDECYEKIIFDAEHVSPASLDADGRVVSVYSFSKTYAMTGWRIGYTVASPELVALFAKLQEMTVACAPSISQKAVVAALAGPQDCVKVMVDAYRERRDLALAILKEHGMPSYVPQGAFYLMIDISSCGIDSDRFAQELLRDEKVAVAPGSTFGPAAGGFVRISLATAKDQLDVGLRRLAGYIRRRTAG